MFPKHNGNLLRGHPETWNYSVDLKFRPKQTQIKKSGVFLFPLCIKLNGSEA